MMRIAVWLMFAATAQACSCMGSGPACQADWKASAVFAGTVMDVSREGAPRDSSLAARVTFDVTEPFIGMERRGKQIEIRTGMGGGDCGYPFQRAGQYVVYAYERNGMLAANICSRTAPLNNAAADLAYLRGLSTAGPLGYVFGVAGREGTGHFDRELAEWLLSGIAGVTVTLAGMGKSLRTSTGGDGAFRFDGLPAGKDDVLVAKHGYEWRAGPRTARCTPAGARLPGRF